MALLKLQRFIISVRSGANSSNNDGAIYNKNGSTIGTIRNEGSIIGYSRGSTYKDAIHNEGGSTIDVIEKSWNHSRR